MPNFWLQSFQNAHFGPKNAASHSKKLATSFLLSILKSGNAVAGQVIRGQMFERGFGRQDQVLPDPTGASAQARKLLPV